MVSSSLQKEGFRSASQKGCSLVAGLSTTGPDQIGFQIALVESTTKKPNPKLPDVSSAPWEVPNACRPNVTLGTEVLVPHLTSPDAAREWDSGKMCHEKNAISNVI